LPVYDSQTKQWSGQLFEVGVKGNKEDDYWAFRGFGALLAQTSFFDAYLAFWQHAFTSYAQRQSTASVYWFTNGCGQPIPRPPAWPQRSGTGYESVSDGKTSVGMDRTDDIKKALYQVLKLGVDNKLKSPYICKVGIISNIHAVRHFDEYLTDLKDIMWLKLLCCKAQRDKASAKKEALQ
jgi:hypothetical protein